MPKSPSYNLFRCYIWLFNTIGSATRPISREEIDRKWAHNISLNPDGENCIPERTFHHWRHACEELFQVNIVCQRSRSGGSYYIENATDIKENSLRQWLISTFAVNDLISEAQHIKNQILFEEIPSGQRFLTTIIEALCDKKVLAMQYRAFYQKEPFTTMISPLCVKVFKQRWYVLALREGLDKPRIYGLDRIHSLEVTDNTYEMPKDFDAADYFASIYGISDATKEPEQVEVRVSAKTADYLRSLPSHTSQREVECTDTHSVFRFFVVPSFEFKQELLTHGSSLEVLSPAWLRKEFADEAAKISKLYSKK